MSKKIVLIDDEDEQLIFTEALKEVDDIVKCTCSLTPKEGMKLLKHLVPDYFPLY